MATSRGMLALLCACIVFGFTPWSAFAQSPSDSCDVVATGEPEDDALYAALEVLGRRVLSALPALAPGRSSTGAA